MHFTPIELPSNSWEGSFKVAQELLADERLHAVAVISEDQAQSGLYTMTVLDPSTRLPGGVDSLLDELAVTSPQEHKGKTDFRLMHGLLDIEHPFFVGTGWMLAIIYND